MRAILSAARHGLSPNGLVTCEIGIGQAEAITQEVATIDGLDFVEIRPTSRASRASSLADEPRTGTRPLNLRTTPETQNP